MSVVAIVTELTAEEISGIVGGGSKDQDIYGKQKAKGYNVNQSSQNANSSASSSGYKSPAKSKVEQNSYQSNDSSADVAVIKTYNGGW